MYIIYLIYIIIDILFPSYLLTYIYPLCYYSMTIFVILCCLLLLLRLLHLILVNNRNILYLPARRLLVFIQGMAAIRLLCWILGCICIMAKMGRQMIELGMELVRNWLQNKILGIVRIYHKVSAEYVNLFHCRNYRILYRIHVDIISRTV